jgi:hypothetical protein
MPSERAIFLKPEKPPRQLDHATAHASVADFARPFSRRSRRVSDAET